MTDNYDRYANATGTPYTVNSTVYDMHATDPGFMLHQPPAGSALERAAFARNIARCCDGDDHIDHATLPTRYNSTVEDCQRWYAGS